MKKYWFSGGQGKSKFWNISRYCKKYQKHWTSINSYKTNALESIYKQWHLICWLDISISNLKLYISCNMRTKLITKMKMKKIKIIQHTYNKSHVWNMCFFTTSSSRCLIRDDTSHYAYFVIYGFLLHVFWQIRNSNTGKILIYDNN